MQNKFSGKELQVEEWIKKAEEDFQAGEILLDEGGLPNPICFHFQQMAEKYLKAFLVHGKKWYPKIHQLDMLWELCIEIDRSFDEIKREVVFLTSFYVTTRYPGDYPSFSIKDAREAYDAAIKVKDFVLGKIK